MEIKPNIPKCDNLGSSFLFISRAWSTTALPLETIGPVTNMFYTRDKCDKEIIFFVFQGEQ